MPATLYLVPNADAAYEHAAALLRGRPAAGSIEPTGRAYLLLPGAAAITEAGMRLHNSAGVQLLDFYRFSGLILGAAAVPAYRISGAASRRLVRMLLQEAHAGGELSSFAAVWDKPGFTQALMEWLREMKGQGITPEQVSSQAARTGSERDRQLGLLYGRYQATLAGRGCADAEGLLWLAAEALEREPGLLAEDGPAGGAGLFLALGFDQFSPVHLRILRAAAAQVARLGIYLPWDADRPADSLALTRLRQTRAALEATLQPAAEVVAEAGDRLQAVPLAGLRRCLYEGGSARDEDPPTVRAIAAPSREAEARRALAAAKSLLLSGARPESIAIACPAIDKYARIVHAVAEEYGVPVAVEQPLALNPAVAALSNVLSLAPHFPRRETLDALRSPYVRQPWLNRDQTGRLDRLTRERPVLSGRDQWQHALEPIGQRVEGEDEDLGAAPLAATLPAEELAAIGAGLAAFFDHVTPREVATYREHALWVQEAILGLGEEGEASTKVHEEALRTEEHGGVDGAFGRTFGGMDGMDGVDAVDAVDGMQGVEGATGDAQDAGGADWKSAPDTPNPLKRVDVNEAAALPGGSAGAPGLNVLGCASEGEWAERDRAALGAFLEGLRELVEAAALVPAAISGQVAGEGAAAAGQAEGEGEGRVTWGAFWEELAQELAGRTLAWGRGEAAVPCLPLVGVRTRPVDHLFVLGLAEGEFPSPPEPDVFYTAAEREAGGYPLSLARIEPAEDASLWWQALGNCRRSLTLLRPRYDEAGAEWLPSPYWDYVMACVEGLPGRVEEPRIAEAPTAAQAAGAGELLVALALSGAAGAGIDDSAQDAPAGVPAAWAAARRAARVMAQRAAWGACGAYEGVLGDEGVRQALGLRYGPDHSWSASRLNRFGACPYSFYASAALDLEPLREPEEGLDAMQRGSIIHRILELLYRGLADAGPAAEPATEDEALRLLAAGCERTFATADAVYGFRPGPLWRYEQDEIRRGLAALVRWECRRDDAGRFRPWRQELRFGVRGAGLPPVLIRGADGRGCLVHGVIDRIDRDEAGRLRVIDYKSGSRKYGKEDVTEGRALQTALYALAAPQAFGAGGQEIAESYYLHVASREVSGKLSFSGPVDEDETALAAAGRAADFAARAAAGQFPAGPSKPMPGRQACTFTCDFAALCAPTRSSIAKARRHIQETGYDGAD